MRSLADVTRLVFTAHYIVSACLCAAAFLAEPDAFLAALLGLALVGTSFWLYGARESNASVSHVRGLVALDACVALSFVVAAYRAWHAPESDDSSDGAPKAVVAAPKRKKARETKKHR